MLRFHGLIAGLLLFMPAARAFAAEDSKPTLGILGALTLEVQELERRMTDRKEHVVRGLKFVTGTLKGQKVVLVHSGIGAVNAGVATELMLEHFEPASVLFTGIAGGLNPDLGVGDIVIGSKTAYHDFGELNAKGFRPFPTVNPIDGKDNPLDFAADAALVSAAEKAAKGLDLAEIKTMKGTRTPRIVTGMIVTGNEFIASAAKREELRKAFKADATEMEGAAVAQICYQHRVPCLIVRSLSDEAGEKATIDYEHFEKIAANNSAKLVLGLIAELKTK
jgi:adenosylhomocysteine nucleosidase